MVRVVMWLLAMMAVSCGAANTAPSVAPSRARSELPIVISGQSNAFNLYYYAFYGAEFLGHPIYPKAVVCAGCLANQVISAWAPGTELWVQLDAGLHQPLTAVVWWQGETYEPLETGHYAADVRDLFRRIRAANGSPHLLIALVQVIPFQNNQAIRSQQADVARTDPDVVLVNVDDIPSDGYNHVSVDPGYAMAAQRILAAIASRF
jgi:hypothetical protein